MKRKDITGIILCGGKSLRMQTNKALLRLGDKTIIEIIFNEMKKVFNDIVLSTNEYDEFSFLNCSFVKDIQIDRGPLEGIYSSLTESTTRDNFFTTCDLPFINYKMIEHISNINSEAEIIIPTIHKIPQRLFGIYKKSVIERIEEIFRLTVTDKTVRGSVFDLHQRVSVELVEITHLPFYNDNMFLNMNTPEDYELIKNICGKK